MTQRSPLWGRSQDLGTHLHPAVGFMGLEGAFTYDEANKTCGDDYELVMERSRYRVAIETWQQ